MQIIKKICILIFLLFSVGCQNIANKEKMTLNDNASKESSFDIEKREFIIYNKYIQSYNIINQNVNNIIKIYKNSLGFSEIPILKNDFKDSFNDEDTELFLKTIEMPLVEQNNPEYYNNLNKKYKELFDSVKILLKSYKKSREYYSVVSSTNVESKYYHEGFKSDYKDFKMKYLDFSNELYTVEVDRRISNSRLLNNYALKPHEYMFDILQNSTDIYYFINNGVLDKKGFVAKHKSIKKDIDKLINIDLNDYEEYNADSKKNINLFIDNLGNIETIFTDIDISIKNKEGIEKVTFDQYRNILNELIMVYNNSLEKFY